MTGDDATELHDEFLDSQALGTDSMWFVLRAARGALDSASSLCSGSITPFTFPFLEEAFLERLIKGESMPTVEEVRNHMIESRRLFLAEHPDGYGRVTREVALRDIEMLEQAMASHAT